MSWTDQLLSLAAAVQGRLQPGRPGPARHDIGQVRESLHGISGSTEGVFLQVGGQLLDLRGRANQLAGITAEVDGALSADGDSIRGLEAVLAEVGRNRQEYGVDAALERLHTGAREVERAIGDIAPVTAHFEVLGVVTRIESARLHGGGADFEGLAESAAALSAQIREQIGATAESAHRLAATSAAANERMANVQRQRKQNLAPLAAQAGTGLENLQKHRLRVAQASRLAGANFEDIGRALADVAQALQCHDIVRQQVEHVVEALERAPRDAQGLGGAAALQAAQLANAKTTFERSVHQIRDALARIESDSARVLDSSSRMLGGEQSTDGSLGAIESNVQRIAEILESLDAADHDLAEAAGSTRLRVSEIARTIGGISDIGFRMQRIALNGTIQASKLGPAGGAIEVVAMAVQTLAREIETAAGNLETRLEALNDGAQALGAALTEQGGSEHQLERLRAGAQALRKAEERALASHNQALELGAALGERLRSTIQLFGEQREFLSALDDAAKRLGELGAGATPMALAELSSTYTMQSERAVHQALIGGDPEAPATPAATTSNDDNVEFF